MEIKDDALFGSRPVYDSLKPMKGLGKNAPKTNKVDNNLKLRSTSKRIKKK